MNKFFLGIFKEKWENSKKRQDTIVEKEKKIIGNRIERKKKCCNMVSNLCDDIQVFEHYFFCFVIWTDHCVDVVQMKKKLKKPLLLCMNYEA